MKITVGDICGILEKLAPKDLAENWDNTGLLLGNPQTECIGVLVSLDATLPVVEEAIARHCNTLVVHHPVIFQPLKKIDTGTAEGRLLQKALANDIAIIACHTNFDISASGVSDYLGKQLGLINRSPLLPRENEKETNKEGLGCIGEYSQPVSDKAFLHRLLDILQLPGVPVAGPLPEKILKVALCGGSGSDFAATAHQQQADIYITSEIKHHIALWAVENKFCLIDGGHYATEKPAIRYLTDWLAKQSRALGWSLDITEAETETAPFIFMQREE